KHFAYGHRDVSVELWAPVAERVKLAPFAAGIDAWGAVLQTGQSGFAPCCGWQEWGSSVFKCKTSRIGPSGPWPSGGCARSSSRSLATPDSSPGSIGPTDSSLTSVHRYAW